MKPNTNPKLIKDQRILKIIKDCYNKDDDRLELGTVS